MSKDKKWDIKKPALEQVAGYPNSEDPKVGSEPAVSSGAVAALFGFLPLFFPVAVALPAAGVFRGFGPRFLPGFAVVVFSSSENAAIAVATFFNCFSKKSFSSFRSDKISALFVIKELCFNGVYQS